MSTGRHAWFWFVLLALFVLALYEFGSVLVPFVVGAAATAVIGVGARFALTRYLAGPFYLGHQLLDEGQ